ncbi:MAG: hypothetical protein HN704_01395 [Bacteroidetes bacterium]|nr:hypothetical protein [Bacteroidota bacterium]MBT7144852.1 hypothetical protein [Bacteroidota bacterium]MBT7490240.1 hypothetical protein [Bacteroidota bacterium]
MNSIFLYYQNELEKRKITFDNVSTFDIKNSQFNICKKDIIERLKIKLRNKGKYSKLLLNQLTIHKCNFGEKFNVSDAEDEAYIEFYNSSEILDIIELIEKENTNLSNQFKHKPLQGLYKFHHNAYSGIGYSLLMNIRNYWFNKQGQIHKKRKADYKNIIDKHKLSKHIIMSNLHSQAIYGNERKLTGEWLIYTRVQEVNYFLCLASHTEGDNSIYENKIKECYNEFPELM